MKFDDWPLMLLVFGGLAGVQALNHFWVVRLRRRYPEFFPAGVGPILLVLCAFLIAIGLAVTHTRVRP